MSEKKLMFPEITKTWNVWVGCTHNCVYCSARGLAETRLKHLPQYQDFSKPTLVEKELQRRFTKGYIFCCNMGDLWAQSTPWKVVEDVLRVVWESPNATFLMLTKNSGRYAEFMCIMPPNVVLGVTIETDRYPHARKPYSLAPSPLHRAINMWEIKRKYPEIKTMVCVEPIIEFDLWTLAPLIMGIRPEYVYLGYDNHKNHLVEPELAKTQKLIEILRPFTEVRIKTLREKCDAKD
jgi:DNA repair photolyase